MHMSAKTFLHQPFQPFSNRIKTHSNCQFQNTFKKQCQGQTHHRDQHVARDVLLYHPMQTQVLLPLCHLAGEADVIYSSQLEM